MGLVDDIKNQVKKQGANKGKFLYFKPDVKIRVRFLEDMEDGHKFLFHDSFEQGVNIPCQELFHRECEYCDNDDLRHRDMYAWAVWDYEAKEVKILMAPVNQCSPVPAIVGMFEAYGTLKDRDYVITQTGKGQGKSFSVVPMDKVKFKNDKAKPFSEKKLLSLLDKAYPADGEDSDEDEDKPAKKGKKGKDKKPNKASKRPKDEDEDEDDIDDDDDDSAEEDGDNSDYEDMSPKELYKECIERGLNVKPKKDAEYYIKKLQDDDESEDEVDDEDW